MSEAKQEAKSKSPISTVQFSRPVPCGSIGSIEYWSRTKHGHASEVRDRGTHIELTATASGGSRQRVRIPLTNILYVVEDDQ